MILDFPLEYVGNCTKKMDEDDSEANAEKESLPSSDSGPEYVEEC